MKIASFDVDAQKGFSPLCPEELPVPEGDTIVPELNYMAQFADYRLGSKDAHPEKAVWTVSSPEEMLQSLDYPEADLTWVKHCVPGTKGFELLDGLPKVTEYDYFVWKGMEPDLHPYGACYQDIHENLSTGVIEFLHAKDIKQIIVGGLAFDYCVQTTVWQLQRAGFEIIVYLPATKGLSDIGSKETQQAFLDEKNIQLIDNREALAAYFRK